MVAAAGSDNGKEASGEIEVEDAETEASGTGETETPDDELTAKKAGAEDAQPGKTERNETEA